LLDPSSKPSAAADLSFEQALQRLQAIVQELEQGELGLDKALERYEEGVKLLRRCHDVLEKAERKIELLSGVDAEGRPITAPLDDASLPLQEKARERSRRRSASPQREPDDEYG
jgi:exodeoxyribonuclease VII small subunit